MASIVAIQHAASEGLGRIEPALRNAGIEIRIVGPDEDLSLDVCREVAGVIVLGGPMGAYETDRHPRLNKEMKVIENALKRRIPLLGICLGSQLLAVVLGAHVRPGPGRELGWREVTRHEESGDDPIFRGLPSRFTALHWHRDIFDPPPDTCSLASSAMTQCQAFRHGTNAWGILFHLEAGLPQVRAMAEAFPHEVHEGGMTSPQLLALTAREDQKSAELAAALFGSWARLVGGEEDGRE